MPRPPPRHRPTNPTGRLHELGYRGPPARAHHRSDRPQRLPRTPPRPHVLLLLHRQPERLNTDPLKTEPQLTSRCSDPLRPPSLPTRLARHGDTPVAAVPKTCRNTAGESRRRLAFSVRFRCARVFTVAHVCSTSPRPASDVGRRPTRAAGSWRGRSRWPSAVPGHRARLSRQPAGRRPSCQCRRRVCR